ncbi:alpha-ribazole phosphatase [Parabacteroides sp. Marseille-P3160]|uniref:alpha-ribazole phosphatase n=1 Tax=Parabacteroides sp. Marseille-P3160 TaxID=1917887 RepID=UPI0009BA1979|nr:alpha-ribazole phosphatase [Parabacteroides sp. Marseille-P3160]
MEIYLIRHTSIDVPAGYAYGQTDVSLKPTFESEALNVRNRLNGVIFDHVWSSPLSRCVRLAAFCGYPDAILDERIKELNFGDWEMKTWEEISQDPRSSKWFNDWINFTLPNGESFMDQYNRVSSFLDDVRKHRFEKVCVFTHGGVLACARVYAGELEAKDSFSHIVGYGESIKLTF